MTANDVTMTTYRAQDPEELILDHEWVTSIDELQEMADASGEPIRLVKEVWVRQSVEDVTLTAECGEIGCMSEATHWGLCEVHAREDDPEAFDDEEVHATFDVLQEGREGGDE